MVHLRALDWSLVNPQFIIQIQSLSYDTKDQRHSLCKLVALGVKPPSWAILGSLFPLEVLATTLSRCVGARRSI